MYHVVSGEFRVMGVIGVFGVFGVIGVIGVKRKWRLADICFAR